MIFVESKDFDKADIIDLYKKTPLKLLPNIICFLNRGVLLLCSARDSKISNIRLFPEFHIQRLSDPTEWLLVPFGDKDSRMAANLGFLLFALVEHLNMCVLRLVRSSGGCPLHFG